MSTNASLDHIVQSITKLTLLETAQLVKELESVLGVSAASMAIAAAPASSGAAAVDEQTEFTVVLESAGDKKMDVIKLIREITSLGLKESKDLSEAGGSIKEGLAKDAATALLKRFQDLGAAAKLV